MSLFNLPLAQVDEARLDELRRNSVREGRRLDYRGTLPGQGERDVRDFLEDATSFANAGGGDLIYGITERRDANGRPTGEPGDVVGLPNVNLNDAILRLSQLLRDAVDPPLTRVTPYPVPRQAGPPCLVLRVPRAWSGLHMITYRGTSRFYSRGPMGKVPMDVTAIREGFVERATRREEITRFRRDRVARVLANDVPAPLQPGSKLVFHGLPLDSDDQAWARFRKLDEMQMISKLRPLDGMPNTFRFNTDGYVTVPSLPSGYVQVFRDGAIEAVAAWGEWQRQAGRTAVWGRDVEEWLIDGLDRFRQAWEAMDVSPPFLLGLALVEVRGAELLTGFDDRSSRRVPPVIDREVVMGPEIEVIAFGDPTDVILRPVFDIMWNAGGRPTSPHYGSDGRWRRDLRR